ncbi:MAG: fibronectin type III domain-containing protein [Candidatus Marinimicrobia bacterium]|nr:fibronectin type III domain-containing protein [Candidatus Neomarinimicrobiota bacterium]
MWNQSDMVLEIGYNSSNYEKTTLRMNEYGQDNQWKDPKFLMDGSADQFQLSDASRLIGTGTLSYGGSTAPSTDILGNARPTADPDRPDMGAYENANINPPYPDKVADLVADPADKSVILSWTANTEANLTKYIIYQSLTQGFTPTSLDSLGESGTNTFTATGLTNRTNYYYRVAAVNDEGNVGELSDEAIAFPEYEGPVWWVAIDGNNTNDGNEANPLGSLSHAAEMAFDGDTIKIKAGTYEDNQSTYIDGKPLTIIGVDGKENTIIDNKGMFNHFGLSNAVIRIKGLSLINGGGGNGGSMDVQNVDSLFIDNSYFGNNSSDSRGGAIRLEESSAYINNSQFHNNRSKSAGGAIYSNYSESHELIIKNSNFEDNRLTMNSGGDMNASGGAISSSVHSKISHSFFKQNLVDMQTGGNQWASGGAISLDGGSGVNEIRGSVFIGNRLYGDGSTSGSGGALLIGAATRIQNNVFANNGVYTPSGGDGTVLAANNGSPILIINNTMYDNDYPGGYSSNNLTFHDFGADGVDLRVFNNVLYTDDSILPDQTGDGSMVKKSNNVLKDNRTLASIDFKNHSGNDFSLRPGSDLIDGGITFHSDGNTASDVYAPIKDLRDYYRIGDPDVGAFEFGASKYLLAFEDNIDGNLDTTFVSLEQEIEYTITTNDIDGNQVSSNEKVTWDVYPNQKYVTISTYDTSTVGGDAVAVFKISDLEKSKGFRFRIRTNVGDSPLESELYVIEEIVTGAPPTVANLTLSPDDWTSDNQFILSWENPTWERDLIGINLMLVDDIGEAHSHFQPFPEGAVLTSYTKTLDEAGEYQAFVWLVDELGNENPSTRDSVRLKFDNVPPNQFNTNGPTLNEWASPQPRFYFDDAGDYPSGVEEYILFINDNIYQTYGGVGTEGNDGYVDIDNPLNDGYYNWYMETKDYAGNVTRSDTSYFGIDTQPPTISHSSPLSIIDEGVDSPPINASFYDAASGVKLARLYYRTAGSGGGTSWKANNIISGSAYIQASDVHHSGIEYYITSEDNLGNQSQWPENEPYQSVKVRSASNISSASRWSSGVPGGTDVTNYQLFSIPFDVGNVKSSITTIMGPADKFKYRLYKYVGGEDPWQEDPSTVSMGEAYFFIFDPVKYEVEGVPTKITFNFGQGVSTPTNPPYEKSISTSDWTLFGNPYNFNLILSNVYTEDGTAIRDAGSLFGFSNGSWTSVSSIQPWQGYAFKSTSATKLIFDGRGTGFGKIAKELDYENIPQDYNEWIIDITAATGHARDELNAVGVRNLAKDGYDPFDEFEPPTLPGDVVLRIDNRDRVETPDIYSKDIRKPNDTGHYWDLQVFAPTNGERTYLTFDGLGYIPEEYDIFLINKTTKQAKNLEWESSYRFANTGSESYLKQDLRLVIGTKDFVKENNAGVNLYPDAFTLSQNYPNPFNPQTSIMISLEEDAQLNLIIYNLLGEEVTRLAMNEHRPAGYYTFIWNGANAMGSKVSTGVYFYHAMIRDAQGKVVLNKTRKMIFLK